MYSRVFFASAARFSAVSSVTPRSFIAWARGLNVYENPLYSAVTFIACLLLYRLSKQIPLVCQFLYRLGHPVRHAQGL
jgi:hypothetical protein